MKESIKNDMPEIRHLRKDAFVRKFVNKPLEHISLDVYEHIIRLHKEKNGFATLAPYFRNLFAHLSYYSCFFDFVLDIHKDVGLLDQYRCGAPGTQRNVRKGVDQALVEEIASLNLTSDKIVFKAVGRSELEPIINKWSALLGKVPSTHTIEFDRDGVITPECLRSMDDNLRSLMAGIKVLAVQALEVFQSSVIKYIKESGIKPSNALYRDIYDCLKMAGFISGAQLKMHDCSTNRYVRENYIKAKYLRL